MKDHCRFTAATLALAAFALLTGGCVWQRHSRMQFEAAHPELAVMESESDAMWRASYSEYGIYLGLVPGRDRDDGAVRVREVAPGTPAARGGLQQGDAIVAINGERSFCSTASFKIAINLLPPGEQALFTVERDGRLKHIYITPERSAAVQSILDGERSREEILADTLNALRNNIFEAGKTRVDYAALIEKYKPAARRAQSKKELYAIINAALAELRYSHLAVFSREASDLDWASFNSDVYKCGFETLQFGTEHYVVRLFAGGAAQRAGIRLGDRIAAVNGVDMHTAPERLVTAYNTGREEPLSILFLRPGESYQITVQSTADPASLHTVTLTADAPDSYLSASKKSVRVIESGGRSLGYVRLWCVLGGAFKDVFFHAMANELKDCDGVILDLRGRGGSPEIAQALRDAIKQSKRPFVVLIDRLTASAKEMAAHLIKKDGCAPLVGETTTGAFLGMNLLELPDGGVMEYPAMDAHPLVEGFQIEGVGIAPDLRVNFDFRYLNGVDPVLEAGILELSRRVDEAKAAAQQTEQPTVK